MNIKVGTLDIIYHGSFLIERGKSFEFDIPDDKKSPMKLILYITEDENIKKQYIKPRLIDNNNLELNLVNFSSLIAGGLSNPVRIGVFKNRIMYFAFNMSSSTVDTMPLFSYTFYLGEKENTND